MPELLPAEFLTEASDPDSDSDDYGDAAAAAAGLSKRARTVAGVEKRLTRLDRGPRDAQRGSTVFRVARARDERLAPAAANSSKRIKDALLRRDRAAVKPRAGFFVGS